MQFESRIQLKKVKNGNTLVIGLADHSDEAEYVCSVSAYKKTEIRHNVRIRGKGCNLNLFLSPSLPHFS
jgi:hypothetical protein